MFFHGFDPNGPEKDPNLKGCLVRGCMLLAVPLGILFIIGSLNYSGFCWSKMRYLSKKDKFRIAFEILNPSETVRIKTKDRETQYYEAVKYKNFEEFMEKNPDCCAINPPGRGYDLPPPRFEDRITGFHNGEVIVMNYTIPYVDENESETSKKREVLRVLQNCGELKW